MTDLMTPTTTRPRPADRDSGAAALLLHEVMARSRQYEAEQSAREYALARSLTAGRGWALIARFAARRAARARACAGAAPPDRGSRSAVGGSGSAV